MLTRMSPARAVANCISVHSAQLGAQMPTRSPTAYPEAIKARVALLGLNARVESATINGKTMYRVRMGPYASASDLAEAKSKLSSGGLPAVAIKAK